MSLWGRFDDAILTAYRHDGTKYYQVNQRHYDRSTAVVYYMEDNRTQAEAREDYRRLEALDWPTHIDDYVYTRGTTTQWGSFLRDDHGFLCVGAFRAILGALRPTEVRRSSTASIALGTDHGDALPLARSNQTLGKEFYRKGAEYRVSERYDPYDTITYQADFYQPRDPIYEVGLFHDTTLLTRHILSRPFPAAAHVNVRFTVTMR